jgi:two-component system OmpR family sensor kinase
MPLTTALSRLSVRHRLTATIALLTTLALVAVGLTLYVLESRRIDRSIESSLTQEIGEFRTLQETEPDPRTQQPFTSTDRVLEVFLERNLPDAHEQLFAFPSSGTPIRCSSDPPSSRRWSRRWPPTAAPAPSIWAVASTASRCSPSPRAPNEARSWSCTTSAVAAPICTSS